MNKETITAIGFTIVGALVCSGLYIGRERKLFEERRKDVESLTRLCLGSTNKIETTLKLMSLAKRQGIEIVSPVPRDPSQLCYVLMNPYDPSVEHSMPKQILILETNVTDKHRVFVSTVDGSVFARSAKPEK